MQLSRRSILVLIGLSSILLIGALITYYVFLSPTGLKARKNADLSRVQSDAGGVYTTLEGEIVDLDSYQEGILIVNSWASWSPYTPTDHAILEKLEAHYGDEVSIVALNRMEAKETATAYLETIGKKDSIVYLVDANDHFFSSLDGYAMPETIVFDSVGNEYFRKRGVLNEAEITEIVGRLIADS